MEEETPTQRQARLRRERRDAKLKAEGQSRLEKITKVSGRQNLPDPPLVQQRATSPSSPSADVDDRNPAMSNFQPDDADIQTLLRATVPNSDPSSNQDPKPDDDPMMRLFSQLMGEVPPGPEKDGAAPGGLPPGLAALMGNGGLSQPENSTQDRAWKILHAVFAFALAIYVTIFSPTLSLHQASRERRDSVTKPGEGINLFWAFATVELVLQSTRYFLERGRTSSGVGGIMGTISTFLPKPWAGYLRLIARYSGIWSTIMEDAYVLVFVIGVVSWWRQTS